MDVMQTADLLGAALAEDERIKRLNAAREIYNSDAELQKLISEYVAQSAAMQGELDKKDASDSAFLSAIESRMHDILDQMSAFEAFKELKAAEDDAGKLINDINTVLARAISGSTCSHENCASCKGCHHGE